MGGIAKVVPRICHFVVSPASLWYPVSVFSKQLDCEKCSDATAMTLSGKQVAGSSPIFSPLQHTATHCNTMQHTATHCNTLQDEAAHSFWHVLLTADMHTVVGGCPCTLPPLSYKIHTLTVTRTQNTQMQRATRARRGFTACKCFSGSKLKRGRNGALLKNRQRMLWLIKDPRGNHVKTRGTAGYKYTYIYIRL